MEEQRRRILKMVKEGRLNVDEALVLLDELTATNDSMKKKEEELYGELSTSFKFEEAKKEDFSSQQKFQSTKDKIFDFVDTTLKKIKDLDLDLNFGKSVDISHIFQHGDTLLNEMDIDLSNGSVKIVPWDQQDVRVECEAKVYRVETQDEARKTFMNDVIFAIEQGKLRFASQQKWMKIQAVIYVPQSDYENIRIRMFNGSIDSENLKVKKYNVKTANGKINIRGMESQNVEAETANGKIEVLEAKIQEIEAETINGGINLDGSFKKVDLQSFNGHITCSVLDAACESIEVKTTTGGIDLSIPEAIDLTGELKTNLGNFHVPLDGMQIIEEKSEVIQKLLRFQPIKQGLSAARVQADTKTGSIKIKRVK